MSNLRFVGLRYRELQCNQFADPGFLCRILIFIHPGSNNKSKRGGSGRKFSVKFVKLFYFQTGTGTDKKLSQLTKNYRTFYPKNVTKLSEICNTAANIDNKPNTFVYNTVTCRLLRFIPVVSCFRTVHVVQ